MLSDELKEELVRGLTEIFQKNMSAIIIKGEMDNQTKKRFISWTADMDIRHERVFSIVDIQEDNMKKWESVLPFYQNIRKEGIVLWRAA